MLLASYCTTIVACPRIMLTSLGLLREYVLGPSMLSSFMISLILQACTTLLLSFIGSGTLCVCTVAFTFSCSITTHLLLIMRSSSLVRPVWGICAREYCWLSTGYILGSCRYLVYCFASSTMFDVVCRFSMSLHLQCLTSFALTGNCLRWRAERAGRARWMSSDEGHPPAPPPWRNSAALTFARSIVRLRWPLPSLLPPSPPA